MFGGDAIKGNVEFLLLGVLREGPAHGYGLIVRLRDRSNGAFDLAEGTIYPALQRLERSGRVESAWSSESGRRRRVYAITPVGETALESGRAEWAAFARGMQAVLEPGT
jgi:PadR family transcriptional regulator, regulatory protein PadR